MSPSALGWSLGFALVLRAWGHGAVTQPAPRTKASLPYCPWCVGEHQPLANPPGKVHYDAAPTTPCMGTSRMDKPYPRDRFGKYISAAGPGPNRYVAAEGFEAHIVLDADHNGEAMWSYCPHSETESEECFRQRPLTGWVDVHSTWGPSEDCGDHCRDGQTFSQTIHLPGDVPLGLITLRWLWVCKNTDETFLSCIDVRVEDGSGVPQVASPPAAPAMPTAFVPSLAPGAPSSALHSPAGACAEAWQRCGGEGWAGPTCCHEGLRCDFVNQWHSQCELGSAGPSPQPEPELEPARGSSQIGGSDGSSSACSCRRSSSWEGGLANFTGGATFCSQNFGMLGPYISAGGGAEASGGWSGSEPCSTGQYSFSAEEGWQISVSGKLAAGKAPYRAFTYAQLCQGRPYRECLEDRFSFSFSFKTEGAANLSAFLKMLFWTDAGALVGLLPPRHPKGDGVLRLVAFMTSDYPNDWRAESRVEDGRWYHLQFDFAPASNGLHQTAVSIRLDGALLGEGALPFDVLESAIGPQLGVYSFDFSSQPWPVDGLKLWIDDVCVGESSGTCPSGSVVKDPAHKDWKPAADVHDTLNQVTTKAGHPLVILLSGLSFLW